VLHSAASRFDSTVPANWWSTAERSSHYVLEGPEMSSTLLWVVAVILVVVGIVQLVQGQVMLAVVFFIGACLVGPGGYSVFHSRRS
jgi:Mg2+/citrate symporter